MHNLLLRLRSSFSLWSDQASTLAVNYSYAYISSLKDRVSYPAGFGRLMSFSTVPQLQLLGLNSSGYV